MRAGDKILFKGESEQGFEFYPGDVYLTLHQEPHVLFKRQKNELLVNLEISLKDAILGFDRKLKHLDGHDVEIVGDCNQSPQKSQLA
jgi:DnaJ-related protein SCJ1